MESNRRVYIAIAAVGLLAIVLSTCFGAVAGGTIGYWAGRHAAVRRVTRSITPVPERTPPRSAVPTPQPNVPVPGLPAGGGAVVTQVIQNGPAAEAGIRVGDVIVAFGGSRVNQDSSLQQLIGRYRPGAGVEITLSRAGQQQKVTVKLGANPEDANAAYLGVYYVFRSGSASTD